MTKTHELAVTRIGKFRGVRLSAEILRRYQIKDSVILEQRENEIALKPRKQAKLSWEETAKAMAAAKEDWSDWDATVADGLNEL
jgi:hypothetical protein